MGAVTKPVESVVKEVTKPVVKVAQAAGVVDKPRAPAAAPPLLNVGVESAMAKAEAAKSEKKEEMASTLRARRRGARALLSEARLNPELGVQTLGSGPGL